MNLREDDTVSAVALVMETSQDTSADVEPEEPEELPEAEAPPAEE
jgi:hypothetical protein